MAALKFVKFVLKRDGTTEKFRIEKIQESIHKAMVSARISDRGLSKKFAERVHESLNKKGKTKVNVSDIKDSVEAVLRNNKLKKVVDSYFLVWLHEKSLKIRNVMKRDGRIEPFHPEKIFKSIQKSVIFARIQNGRTAERLTRQVLEILDKRYGGKTVPVEIIKETVEYVMIKHKLPKVAKGYILYRYI